MPHGRTVLARHPGQVYGKCHNNSASENTLMYKLTNFAIKDESLLESKESEEEWWCVREVYYRGVKGKHEAFLKCKVLTLSFLSLLAFYSYILKYIKKNISIFVFDSYCILSTELSVHFLSPYCF